VSLVIDACSVTLGGARVLDQVSARVGPGEWLGVVGPNGAGKSTLSRAVTGLVPFDGAIEAAGHDISGCDRRQWARLVAYVPQRPVLPPAMTVADYVLLGRSAHHSYLGAETPTDRKAAAAVLNRLDLASFAHRPLSQLSGGEAQRAVLARALVQEAPVLVMDEPTTSLDLGHSQLVLELTDELRRENGLSVVCTMHDLTLAGYYSDRLLALCGGRAVLSGPPEQVLTKPNIERFFLAGVEVLDRPYGPAVLPIRTRTGVPCQKTM
jgi:iron complex transport system ATP-binding protein